MLQGSGKPGVPLTVVWSSAQEPGRVSAHNPVQGLLDRACELLTWGACSQQPSWEQTQDVFNSYADVNACH